MSEAFEKITLRQLQIFLTVVEHKSFVAAAAQLDLTPPAVSMQMSRLSEVLDAPLFNRDGRSIQLTPAATALIPYAERMTEALLEACNVIDGLQGKLDNLVRVAMVTTSRNFGPHLLQEFGRQHPEIQIETTIANRERVVDLLQTGAVDLALMGRPPQSIEVEALPFAPHPYVLIGPPEHPLAKKHHIARRELVSYKFIAREPGSGTRMLHDYYFASHSVQLPPIYLVMDSNENIKQAVMADMGLAFISAHTIALECQAKKLRILQAEDMPAMREWFTVHPKGKQLRPAAERFRAFVSTDGRAFMQRFFSNLPKALLRV